MYTTVVPSTCKYTTTAVPSTNKVIYIQIQPGLRRPYMVPEVKSDLIYRFNQPSTKNRRINGWNKATSTTSTQQW